MQLAGPLFPYLRSLIITILVTILLFPFRSYLGQVNVAMLLLLPVLFSAAKWGTEAAVASATAGALIFDLFFVPPTLSFTVVDARYLISFSIFLLVAVFTGTLSVRLKLQIENSRRREARAGALYALSRDITAVAELEPVLESVTRKIAGTMEGQVVIIMPDNDGKLQLRASSDPGETGLSENELEVAAWVFKQGQKAGWGTDTMALAGGLFLPLRADGETRGVLEIRPSDLDNYYQPEQIQLLEAMAGLTALAVTRIQLAGRAREVQTLAESERLRTALFNSLSHDLRTPLASITGAVSVLLEDDHACSPAARRDLLLNIQQGASRMNRFVSNLLDMARLESGMLKLKKEWCDVQDIIGVAVTRNGESLARRPLEIIIQPGLPLVQADFVLIEQVLTNLLDNALKYSEPAESISITACNAEEYLEIAVADCGTKVPAGDLGRLFDKFYRLKSHRPVSGTGLGLAICKGIIEAHGGRIWADNREAGGMVFTFALPLGESAPWKVPDAAGNSEVTDGGRHGEKTMAGF
ncbi:MAG: Sensor protein KdpD [Firmicutes bacterium ADurb.Bin456]|nr:MAG: Sensor protein KdpD [Firmicutes bacterium ADurb.Bin456]